MAKRPTTQQIVARQKRLERYQGATGKSNKEIAREFGISTKQVERFKGDPKSQRRGWSHATASKKLFEAVGAPTGKGSTKVEGVRIYKAYTPKQRYAPQLMALPPLERDRIYRAEIAAAGYDTYRGPTEQTNYTHRVSWADYTESRGLPLSRQQIEDMHDNGEIDDDLYAEAMDRLKDIYGKN